LCKDGVKRSICSEAIKILKSNLNFSLGNYEISLAIIEEVLSENNNVKGTELELMAMLTYANSLFKVGNMERALECTNLASYVLSKLNLEISEFLSITSSIINIKGNIHWAVGEWDKALEKYKHCLAIRQQIQDPILIAGSLNNLGLVYRQKGDLLQALEYYQNALEIFKKHNKKQTVASIHNNIGVVYRLQGNLDQALEYYQKSLQIFEEIGKADSIASRYENIGVVYYQKNELNLAQSNLKKAFNIIESIGNDINISHTLFYLLLVAISDGNTRDKEEYFSYLKKVCHRTDNFLIVLRCKIIHALILMAKKRLADTVEAKSLFIEIINDKHVNNELEILAMLYICEINMLELKLTDDDEIFREAQEIISRLENIAHSQNSFYLLIETQILQSKFLLLKGEFSKSIDLLNKASVFAKENTLDHFIIKIQGELGVINSQLELWNSLYRKNASMRQKIDHAKILDYIEEIKRVFFD
ncbi:MAG: tetratricopeptide repeat protein, partial [Candidatus Kariarchaeaceae archaeon]